MAVAVRKKRAIERMVRRRIRAAFHDAHEFARAAHRQRGVRVHQGGGEEFKDGGSSSRHISRARTELAERADGDPIGEAGSIDVGRASARSGGGDIALSWGRPAR